MARTRRSLTLPEVVAGTLLVTIGVFGLTGRMDILVTRLSALSGQSFQWWPLLLVAIGLVQLSVHAMKSQAGRK